MKFKKKLNFSNLEKFELLEKWIIIHSILYYVYDNPIVEDYQFDMNCKQLMSAVQKAPKAFKKSKYYYIFKHGEDTPYYRIHKLLAKRHRKLIKGICKMLLNSKFRRRV